MILHCAGRLGLLTGIYQQRHQIAQALGLIAEIPIAMCNSEYSFNQELRIEIDDVNEESLPSAYQAREIILFCYHNLFQVSVKSFISAQKDFLSYVTNLYESPERVIFLPPKI
jgi:hypothetical protein